MGESHSWVTCASILARLAGSEADEEIAQSPTKVRRSFSRELLRTAIVSLDENPERLICRCYTTHHRSAFTACSSKHGEHQCMYINHSDSSEHPRARARPTLQALFKLSPDEVRHLYSMRAYIALLDAGESKCTSGEQAAHLIFSSGHYRARKIRADAAKVAVHLPYAHKRFAGDSRMRYGGRRGSFVRVLLVCQSGHILLVGVADSRSHPRMSLHPLCIAHAQCASWVLLVVF